MLKVVLDTNIIISAAHNPVGKPALVLAIALSEEPALVSLYPSQVWQKYQEVITRDKFMSYPDTIEPRRKEKENEGEKSGRACYEKSHRKQAAERFFAI